MPERARIFTLSETVAWALADTRALSGRVHRFDEVKNLVLPSGGLFVARVPPQAWSHTVARDPAFHHEDAWGSGRPVVDFPEARSRFGWLEGVWPPAACLRFLREQATVTQPLAYYHQMERGDDLYYEFGWLAAGDEELVVQQTFLVDTKDACCLGFRAGRSAPSALRSALATALIHLGLLPTIQFFWPEDEIPESDWPPLN